MAEDNRALAEDDFDEEFQQDSARAPSWAAPEINYPDDSEDRTFSRRRSTIECCGIEIQIVDTEIHDGHTLYLIKAISGLRNWYIKRRYKDFDYLDKQLRKCYPALNLPTLPPKSYWRSSNDPSIVDQRKLQLQTYLNSLISMTQIWNRNDLVLFLNDESNIMTFIWSVDRMRRLKDKLRLTKVENESEAERLNSDLEDAKTQVQQLQAKLSQMEMIFMQQATGVASQTLSTSVLRSLSRADNPLSVQLALELTQEHAALYGEEGNNADDLQVDIAGPSATGATDEDSVNEGKREEDEESPMDPEELMKALSLAQGGGNISEYVLAKKQMTPDEARTLTVSYELAEALRISNELLHEGGADEEVSAGGGGLLRENSGFELLLRGQHMILSAAVSTLTDKSHALAAAWVQPVTQAFDEILDALIPTVQSLDTRMRIFKFVRDLVSRTLGCQLFPNGSFVSHTYLPDGDIDATAFVPKMTDDSWFVKINEALCLSAFSNASRGDGLSAISEEFTVSNVSFQNSENKHIRSIINGVSVDISTNQLSSILMEGLIEKVDNFVGENHLFKRSLLLVKAWIQYESVRFSTGSSSNQLASRLSTGAVVSIVTYVFNRHGAEISSPLQALLQFLGALVHFDWSEFALSVKGPIRLSEIDTTLLAPHSVAAGLYVSTGFLPDSVFDFVITDEIKSERGQRVPTTASAAAAAAAAAVPTKDAPVESSAEAVPKAADSNAVDSTASLAIDASAVATPAATTENTPVPPPTSSPKPSHATKREYKRGLLNVIDPFHHEHNLLDGFDSCDVELFLNSVRSGYQQLQVILDDSAASVTNSTEDARNRVRGYLSNIVAKFLSASARASSSSNHHSAVDDEDETATSTVAGGGAAQNSAVDVFAIAQADWHFSRCYGSIAMGGKIELSTLTQMILLILDKKGPMPVGEIGKNLQAILGCENLSRRLKDQFTGLKRAIEHAGTPRLRVGNEHQFNPVVSLVGEGSVLDFSASSPESLSACPWTFSHAAFLFTPYQISLTMQAQAARELQLQTQRLAQQKNASNASLNSAARRSPYGHNSGANSNHSSSSNLLSTAAIASAASDLSISTLSTHTSARNANFGGEDTNSPYPSQQPQQRSRGNSGSNFYNNSNNSNNNSGLRSGGQSPSNRYFSRPSPGRQNSGNNSSFNNGGNGGNNNSGGHMLPPNMPIPGVIPIPIDPHTGTPMVPPPPHMHMYPPTMLPPHMYGQQPPHMMQMPPPYGMGGIPMPPSPHHHPGHPAYYHNSMASSLSSSYGAGPGAGGGLSPMMGMSPNPGYMHIPPHLMGAPQGFHPHMSNLPPHMQQQHMQQPQPQHFHQQQQAQQGAPLQQQVPPQLVMRVASMSPTSAAHAGAQHSRSHSQGPSPPPGVN